MEELGASRRPTNINITRALEGFHHLVEAGDGERLQNIAVELLSGNLEWARQRIERLYSHLHNSKAPIKQLRCALQYAAILNPDDHKVQRFIGESWQKEEGLKSPNALACFENACRLRPDFPPYWANLGKALLQCGREGAIDFLSRIESLRQSYPHAIDEHVRAIQADCLKRAGDANQAAALRMERINAGSRNAAFYCDEAKARLQAGNAKGALEILDLADKNCGVDDYTTAIRASALRRTNRP